MKTILIGSIEIPLRSALDCETGYEWLGGETILRTIGGVGIKQETWRRLRVTISGSGWIPPGLEGLDTSTQQVVSCVVPVAISCDVSRQATLPVTRRADSGYQPWALALLADGSAIETPVSFSGDTGTADSVSGAVGYQILYYPKITAWVSRPGSSGDHAQAAYRWELICEQV